jgi:WD40 repeat protein
LSLWPLTTPRPHVLSPRAKALRDIAFDPLGRWVAAGGTAGVFVWPLRADLNRERVRLGAVGRVNTLEASPRGELLAAAAMSGVWLIPLDGDAPRQLPGFKSMVTTVAFDRSGRRLAAGGGLGSDLVATGEAVVRVWDLDTGDVQVLDARDGKPIIGVEFMADGRLLASGLAGLRLWDPQLETSSMLSGEQTARTRVSPDGRFALGIRAMLRPGGIAGTAFVYDFSGKRAWDLSTHGADVGSIAWHPSGTQVVTGGKDGIVRVGAVNGDEPHLLIGHEAAVWSVDVDPEGRSIASTGEDGTVRLWPMPGQGPPLHAWPLADLLDRLRSLTNYRIVEDASSASGYRVDIVPFTGWSRTPPRWWQR